MKKSFRIAILGVLTALAICIHSLEAMIPIPIAIPGVKLGLANVVALLALVLLDGRGAFTVTLLRIVLTSLLFGTFFTVTFFLSLGGGLLSTLVMIFAYKYLKGFSLIGVSILGAIFHNLGQLAVAGLIMEQPGIFYYLPVLLVSAIPTGLIIGLIVKALQGPLERILPQRKYT